MTDFEATLAGIAPAFAYRDGRLHADATPLDAIADAANGPVYAYALNAIAEAYQDFADAFAGQPTRICYALKANDSIGVLKTLLAKGAGVDVVSGGELALALSAGASADKIVFSGVGKTNQELSAALDAAVMQINVESEAELERLNQVAVSKGVQAPIALRVNPDVDAGTLDAISTGRATDKFGVNYGDAERLFQEAARAPGLKPMGIAMHIGSQIGDVAHSAAACAKLRTLWDRLAADGVTLRRFDVGGGLGIRYKDETPPSIQAYADTIRAAVADIDCEVMLEPGRRIVGPAGVLIANVIGEKMAGDHRVIILDAAMNDLIRPALYKAWHEVVPLKLPAADAELTESDIVGPICESTDKFADRRMMPPLAAGDRVAFLAAGAYGAVMASEYNGRPRAPEAVVQGQNWGFARKPRTYQDLIREQSAPDWI